MLYNDNEHQSKVEQYLCSIANDVDTSAESDEEMLSIYKSKLETDVPRGSIELSDLAIDQMAKRVNVGKYIKDLLKQNPQLQ